MSRTTEPRGEDLRTTTLAEAPLGEPLRVVSVAIDAATAGWLAAVGLATGEELVVLRHAALGGPLHLRLEAGGELAVARDLASLIDVERASS